MERDIRQEGLALGLSGDGNTADFRQTLIDLQVTTIATERCKPNRCGIVNQPKLGDMHQSLDLGGQRIINSFPPR